MGTSLHIEGLHKAFGHDRSVPAVRDLDLAVDPGEMIVLLGPSGCGKTTLLRCLAGLETPDSGSIRMGDQIVSDNRGKRFVPTHQRKLGMVFQSYSLWPHMTVAKNVEYPLRTRKVKRATAADAVTKALALVECTELRERYPAQLSGGQQQRVALARAVVADVGLVLFDEPLSNLDFRLRAQLRADLRELHRRLGFTGIYVTHDQIEAFQLGTRVAVMRLGAVEQLGTPREVHDAPASAYVAAFLGIENRLSARCESGTLLTLIGRLTGPFPMRVEEGARYEVFVRARDVSVVGDDQAARDGGDSHQLIGRLDDLLYSGERVECIVSVGDTRLSAALRPSELSARAGDRVRVGVQAADLLIYPLGASLDRATAGEQPVEPRTSEMGIA